MRIIQFRLRIRRIIEQCLGLHMIRTLHHGHRLCSDLKRCGGQILTVFDIGANIGQSALRFGAAFPAAQIHCFEPAENTFNTLKKNLEKHTNIWCHKMALGSSYGKTEIYLTNCCYTTSLRMSSNTVGTERVDISTVDRFAEENQIAQVHLLKIDAEGFDLEVLKGSEGLLSSAQIRFILIEVGFQAEDTNHVLLADVSSYLLPKGYALFGIYDQQPEWKNGKILQYANACFLNQNWNVFT